MPTVPMECEFRYGPAPARSPSVLQFIKKIFEKISIISSRSSDELGQEDFPCSVFSISHHLALPSISSSSSELELDDRPSVPY